MYLTYRYRMTPDGSQTAALSALLSDMCLLYNAALLQRRTNGIDGDRVIADFHALRLSIPSFRRWPMGVSRRVIERIETSRRQHGGSFPFSRRDGDFNAVEYRIGEDASLRKDGTLSLTGIPGGLSIVWHRSLPDGAKPASVILTRDGISWYASFKVAIQTTARPSASQAIGIDLGIHNFLTLSNGEIVATPDWLAVPDQRLIELRADIAGRQPGSSRHRAATAALFRHQTAEARRRSDFLHKLSRSLVDRFSFIAIEDLDLEAMKQTPFSTAIGHAGWGDLRSMLEYKTKLAGGMIVAVDPRGTSQTCSQCGQAVPKSLRVRMHECPCCGLTLDRDVNAARNILNRALSVTKGRNIPSEGERAYPHSKTSHAVARVHEPAQVLSAMPFCSSGPECQPGSIS